MANKSQSDLRDYAIEKVFVGHHNPLEEIAQYDGSPNGALTASFARQLCFDYTNVTWYINSYTSLTTWLRIV